MKEISAKSVRSQVKNLQKGESIKFPLSRIALRSARTLACETSVEVQGHIAAHLLRDEYSIVFTREY